jgi:hypothetical protein
VRTGAHRQKRTMRRWNKAAGREPAPSPLIVRTSNVPTPSTHVSGHNRQAGGFRVGLRNHDGRGRAAG